MKYENLENKWKKIKSLSKFPLKFSINLSFKIVSLDEEKQNMLLVRQFYFKLYFITLLTCAKCTVSVCQSASFLHVISQKRLKCDSLMCPRQHFLTFVKKIHVKDISKNSRIGAAILPNSQFQIKRKRS